MGVCEYFSIVSYVSFNLQQAQNPSTHFTKCTNSQYSSLTLLFPYLAKVHTCTHRHTMRV